MNELYLSYCDSQLTCIECGLTLQACHQTLTATGSDPLCYVAFIHSLWLLPSGCLTVEGVEVDSWGGKTGVIKQLGGYVAPEILAGDTRLYFSRCQSADWVAKATRKVGLLISALAWHCENNILISHLRNPQLLWNNIPHLSSWV